MDKETQQPSSKKKMTRRTFLKKVASAAGVGFVVVGTGGVQIERSGAELAEARAKEHPIKLPKGLVIEKEGETNYVVVDPQARSIKDASNPTVVAEIGNIPPSVHNLNNILKQDRDQDGVFPPPSGGEISMVYPMDYGLYWVVGTMKIPNDVIKIVIALREDDPDYTAKDRKQLPGTGFIDYVRELNREEIEIMQQQGGGSLDFVFLPNTVKGKGDAGETNLNWHLIAANGDYALNAFTFHDESRNPRIVVDMWNSKGEQIMPRSVPLFPEDTGSRQ